MPSSQHCRIRFAMFIPLPALPVKPRPKWRLSRSCRERACSVFGGGDGRAAARRFGLAIENNRNFDSSHLYSGGSVTAAPFQIRCAESFAKNRGWSKLFVRGAGYRLAKKLSNIKNLLIKPPPVLFRPPTPPGGRTTAFCL